MSVTFPCRPLFVPASKPELFGKAFASGADALIADLEDGVAIEQKEDARAALAHAITQSLPVYVRVNAVSSREFDKDMAALRTLDIAGIMLAKAESPHDVSRLHETLGRPIAVIALVETPRAFADLTSLLAAPTVIGAAIGTLDLSAELGCDNSWEALGYFRSALVLASRLSGKAAPLDGVTTNIADYDVTFQDSRRAVAFGFGGKLAIHPNQIEAIKAGFRPSQADIGWAHTILGLDSSAGVVRFAGTMVDKPVIDRARSILRRAGEDPGHLP